MKRGLAALAGITLFLGVTVPAQGSHPTQICIDVEYEDWYPTAGDDIVDELRAYVGATDDDHEEPHQEGCVTGAPFLLTTIVFCSRAKDSPPKTPNLY